ncbi:hypothetical protein RB594_005286 [Gaeumannomyces avenae]
MATTSSAPGYVRFTGHRNLTQRLVLSTLTGKPIHISGIRSSSPTAPGLAPHEISFLRLLEAVTNGSSIQISYTGTTMTYHPGLITGSVPGGGASAHGDVIEYTLSEANRRGISYFLIPLALLAPFSKAHMNVRFSGPGVITAATELGDMSVDSFRLAILPLYGLFGIPPARIDLLVRQRSCAGFGERRGGGVVEMRFASQVRLPKTLHMNRSPGRIKRIGGVAYSTGVSASNNKRMIHAARSVLNALTGEIKIGEASPGKDDARNKIGIGFGLSLVAESSVPGIVYSADVVSPARGGALPEDLGVQCAHQLLEAIAKGGCVSWAAARTVLTLMAMGSEDVGRLRIGSDVMDAETIGLARDLRKFGASSWGFRPVGEDDTDDMMVTVKGAGVGNVGRKIA